MIFKQWKQVLDGSKTQTRRLVKEDDYTWVNPIASLATSDLIYTEICGGWPKRNYLKWAVGRTYAVQPGRGKKAVGRIRMTKIRRERLQEIEPEEFRREGLISGAPIMILFFIELWDGIYHKPYRWDDNPEVLVLDFELVEAR